MTDHFEIIETTIGFEVLRNGRPIRYGSAWTTRQQAQAEVDGLEALERRAA